MSQPLWAHRPSVEEHEKILRAMEEGGYTSISSFVREAVLRLANENDKRAYFSALEDASQQMYDIVQKMKGNNGQT